MAEKRKISLVLADVDGTLVTEQKVLTERAQAAVRSLRAAGTRFAITSGRPPAFSVDSLADNPTVVKKTSRRNSVTRGANSTDASPN